MRRRCYCTLPIFDSQRQRESDELMQDRSLVVKDSLYSIVYRYCSTRNALSRPRRYAELSAPRAWRLQRKSPHQCSPHRTVVLCNKDR